ncbi:MAG: metal-dependent transcriptional regulator [Methanopyri archaeon]|nr:metal-dependent transcriptional regulator [Methanopyri archaeon]
MKMSELSSRMEDYLEAIYVLSRERGFTTISELSEFLGVSKPTVLEMVRKLSAMGYVVYGGGRVEPTEEGERIGRKVWERHREIASFLKFLGVEPEKAELDACRMEHAMDEESYDKIRRLFRMLKERYGSGGCVDEIIDEIRRG